ncbi:MAG: hypothetical protein Q9195_006896 [Heterodermia aff. obscurata]
MAPPRRNRRLHKIQAEQLSSSPELSLRRRARDVISLDSAPTAKASVVDPGKRIRGNRSDHPSATPTSSARQGQAEDIMGFFSTPKAKPPAGDWSLLIEDPSSATERPKEEQAASALLISLSIARNAMSLIEAHAAKPEGGTPTVRNAGSSSASPHPSVSKVPFRQSPRSPFSTHLEAHPELPLG